MLYFPEHKQGYSTFCAINNWTVKHTQNPQLFASTGLDHLKVQCSCRYMFAMLSGLLFLIPSILSHQTTRYHGAHGMGYQRKVQNCNAHGCSTDTFERILEFFDSIAGCARLCRKLEGKWSLERNCDSINLFQTVWHLKPCLFKTHREEKTQPFEDFAAAFLWKGWWFKKIKINSTQSKL